MGKTSSMQEKHQQFAVRDLGLASALAAAGWPASLEDRQGTVYFLFQGKPEHFHKFEAGFWAGSLKLSARDLLLQQKALKGRLYAIKSRTSGEEPQR